MNVGILTFHYALNYGAVLQAYGLQLAIRGMGADAFILDYRSPAILSHNRPLGILRGRFFSVMTMRWNFSSFVRKHLKLTRRLETITDLEQEAQKFDAIIVGSDQVWNTVITKGADPAYYLNLRGGFKRIAYAACFGQKDQPEKDLPYVGELLQKFHHLSVRNETCRDMVFRISSRTPEIVVDPVFLYDFHEFSKCVPGCQRPYILIHSIWDRPDQMRILNEIAKDAHDFLGYPRVALSHVRDFKPAERQVRNAGPDVCHRLFNNAAFIITDSFHAAMFAVKYRKPFIAVANNEKGFRIADCLHRWGIGDRLVHELPANGLKNLIINPIDYDSVYGRLDAEISSSRDYLNRALFE